MKYHYVGLRMNIGPRKPVKRVGGGKRVAGSKINITHAIIMSVSSVENSRQF